MAQNIYDDPEFLAGYAQLPRSVQGLDGAPEWPALRAMLPAVDRSRVLDLGCGFGWFCQWAHAHGASTVLGVDISTKMLERAARASAPDIVYRQIDLDKLDPSLGTFDLVYSSLALHYVNDFGALAHAVHHILAPDGSFVFSVEHPLFSAPSRPEFVTTDSHGPFWPLDNYLAEGERITDWFADGVVKFHRSIATYVSLLIDAGFTLTHLDEWGPTDTQVAEHPEWALERHRPPFLLVGVQRREQG